MDLDDFLTIHREISRLWNGFLARHTPRGESALHGFRLLQFCRHINDHPGCPLRDAAEAAGITSGTASAWAETLCRRELLRREPFREDRRRVRLRTTQATAACLRRIEMVPARAGSTAGEPSGRRR